MKPGPFHRWGKNLLRRIDLLDPYVLLRTTYRQMGLELRMHFRHGRAKRQIARIVRTTHPLQLELGGGDNLRAGWINVDIWGRHAELTLDLRRGLPLPDQCADRIHSEHTLEHFSYPDPLARLLRDCFRVLKVGGEFHAAVPDFARALRLYADDDEARFYDGKFWSSPTPNWCAGPMDELAWLLYMNGHHRFLFDEQNLIAHLYEAGFAEARVRGFDPALDSEDRRPQSLYVMAFKRTATPFYEPIHRGLQANDEAAYDALWREPAAARLYAAPARRALWRLLAGLIDARRGPILDIGCGDGQFLAMIAAPPHQLHGIDRSTEAVRQAGKRLPDAHVQRADLESLPYPTGFFGSAVLCETLEHVANPAAALAEAHRVLRPGGRLLISIPNGAQDSWKGHAHFWTDAEFQEFAKDYRIVDRRSLDQGITLLFVIEKGA